MKIRRNVVRIVIRHAMHISMVKRVPGQLTVTLFLISAICTNLLAGCAASDPSSAFRDLPRSPANQSCQIVAPGYPDDARKDGKGGAVGVTFIVEADGTITNAYVDQGSGSPALDAAARTAVMQGRCSPYVLDGVARRVTQSATIQFSMSPSLRTLSPDSSGYRTASAAVLARSIAARKGRPADWVMVAVYNGSHVELDRSSIQVKGRTVDLWMRTQWNEPYKISIAFIPVTEQLTNCVIDCEHNRATVSAGVFSNRQGPLDPPVSGSGSGEIHSDSLLAKVAAQYCVKEATVQ